MKKPTVLKAGYTVEMSLLMPIILWLFMGCVMAVFYFHDKNILNGAAYETAVVGSTQMREPDGVTEEDLIGLCRRRIGTKCFLMTDQTVSVDITDEDILVMVTADNGYFSLSVKNRAAVTEPEKKIRDADRATKIVEKGFEIIKNGASNHDQGTDPVSGGLSDADAEQ